MSKERELLKRATQIIETLGPDNEAYDFINKVDEILAEPEPEPEAWILIDKETGIRIQRVYKPEKVNKDKWELYPLYSAPPKQKPLSDEAITALDNSIECAYVHEIVVRLIEKAHGIGEL